MGKLSYITIFLLMVNIIGFIYLTDASVESNPYVSSNSVLSRLYTPPEGSAAPAPGEVTTTYTLGESSSIAGSIPTEPPDNFIESTAQFIDRIFILFDFVRVILAFLFVPAALFSFALALPWELTMLLGLPIATLYVIGIIDVYGGGDS